MCEPALYRSQEACKTNKFYLQGFPFGGGGADCKDTLSYSGGHTILYKFLVVVITKSFTITITLHSVELS